MKINFSAKVYLILILLSSILITWPLFRPGLFFHHDDLQVMRIFEMQKCFQDLQIPCRWVPDMGYGNGYPLFNYYSELPYYIGASLGFLIGLINSAKALFFIPLILGGVSMFLLAKKLFGKEAAFLSAILFSFAPYRALDSFVRGAVAENFAIAVVPLVFYFVLEIIEKPTRKNLILGSLSLGGFLLCHNIMTMLFMPFLFLWSIIFLYFNKWKNWRPILATLFLGIGLAGFFLVPVFLEKNLVQTETLLQGGSNFRTHFVTVNQLFFDRSWGYGGSQFGPNDTISFQIGWPHWWFVIFILPLLILKFKKDLKFTLTGLFLLGMFLLSIFMQHNKSAFIWEAIGNLQYAQFPWRFLSLSIFSTALLGGLFFYWTNFKFKDFLIWVIVVFTILMNWSYFQPREFYPWINDKNKLENPLWEIQQKAGIMDYLPKTAYEPQGPSPDHPEIINGAAFTSNYLVRSNRFSFTAEVNKDAKVEIPVFDFPNWVVYVNGEKFDHNRGHLGRISIDLKPGSYSIEGKFKDTIVRAIANFITLISLIVLVLIYRNKKFLNT